MILLTVVVEHYKSYSYSFILILRFPFFPTVHWTDSSHFGS